MSVNPPQSGKSTQENPLVDSMSSGKMHEIPRGMKAVEDGEQRHKQQRSWQK
jgi:hypothetical protein